MNMKTFNTEQNQFNRLISVNCFISIQPTDRYECLSTYVALILEPRTNSSNNNNFILLSLLLFIDCVFRENLQTLTPEHLISNATFNIQSIIL